MIERDEYNTVLVSILRFSSNISKTSASVSSGVPNTEKHESMRPQAECFYCFEVFGTPDETRTVP